MPRASLLWQAAAPRRRPLREPQTEASASQFCSRDLRAVQPPALPAGGWFREGLFIAARRLEPRVTIEGCSRTRALLSRNILCSAAAVVVAVFASQRQSCWPIAGVVRREHVVEIDCIAASTVRRTVQASLFAAGLLTLEHQRFVLKIYRSRPPSGELPASECA